jgi:hypothetical protein
MAQFNLNDRVAFVRRAKLNGTIYDTINTGTIIYGPFVGFEDETYYHIKWDKEIPGSNITGIQLTSCLPSTKYEYIKLS